MIYKNSVAPELQLVHPFKHVHTLNLSWSKLGESFDEVQILIK